MTAEVITMNGQVVDIQADDAAPHPLNDPLMVTAQDWRMLERRIRRLEDSNRELHVVSAHANQLADQAMEAATMPGAKPLTMPNQPSWGGFNMPHVRTSRLEALMMGAAVTNVVAMGIGVIAGTVMLFT